jgi:hypothetical protein
MIFYVWIALDIVLLSFVVAATVIKLWLLMFGFAEGGMVFGATLSEA